ncbi:MAG: DUF1501 domain-containing protein [Myxococcales bacterium]|nr:DUF1501 domain-containing protein [Myxococcales bacterium]MCB9650205.1 DUF1501 domain-containing protein [Deltaproteobacteria bacterium]
MVKNDTPSLSRRAFLGSTALGGAGLLLGSMLPGRALAQTAPRRRFVFAYFDGGWDILLGLDPRDPATTRADVHKIQTGYEQLGGVYQARGVQRRGDLAFGPAVPPELLAHAPDLTIINGIGMDTAAHEVGRRYFITGRFPRGIQAVGSSTPSEIVAQLGDQTPIPHLSAAVEAYATGLPAYATPLAINSVTDLIVALTPFAEIDPSVLAAVQAYQDQAPGCGAKQLDRDGLSTTLLRNQQRARSYIEQQLSQIFNVQRPDAEMAALRALYGIVDGDTGAPDSPEMLAFLAGQALKEGVSEAVSVRLASGLDTHSNWAQDHAPRQERGWRALAALLSDLKASPGTEGGSLFDETVVLVFSEFGRTPLFNNLRGRDHFLGNSCLVAGAGLKRGVTIGGSASVGMMPVYTRLATGEAVDAPSEAELSSGEVVTLSPKHVLATLLAASGLDYSYLREVPIRGLLA